MHNPNTICLSLSILGSFIIFIKNPWRNSRLETAGCLLPGDEEGRQRKGKGIWAPCKHSHILFMAALEEAFLTLHLQSQKLHIWGQNPILLLQMKLYVTRRGSVQFWIQIPALPLCQLIWGKLHKLPDIQFPSLQNGCGNTRWLLRIKWESKCENA